MRITLHNTNGNTVHIDTLAPYSQIATLVERIVDVHNYAFDAELYDQDVELISRMVQAGRVMDLRMLLEDTDMSLEYQGTTPIGIS